MAKSKSNPDEYEVGYGRPPESNRFKPGQSGNAKGRPKGSQNFATVFRHEMDKTVSVVENGQRKQLSKKQVIARQIVNKAAAGDPKATSLVVNEIRHQDMAQGQGQGVPAHLEITNDDDDVWTTFLTRVQAQLPSPPHVVTGQTDPSLRIDKAPSAHYLLDLFADFLPPTTK